MLMFPLTTSCLTTSSLPQFMDLTFQVPMQHSHSIGHSSPATSTAGCHLPFGSASSFLLELFFCSSPVAYWTPTDLGGSSFTAIHFCLFILFMECSRQECQNGLPFPSPVDHILSELSTVTRPSGWPYTEWLIVSLSCTKLWSM